MWPNSYFPNSYWPKCYWPKTGGEILARAGGLQYGAGRIHQLLLALSRREIERSLLDEQDKKRMFQDVQQLTLAASLRRAKETADMNARLRAAENAAYAIVLSEI